MAPKSKASLAVVTATAFIALAVYVGGYSPSHGTAGTNQTPQQTLTAAAQGFAANNSDTAAVTGTGVQTTLGQAVALVDPGDQVLPDDPAAQTQTVYTVQIVGSFTGALAKTPPGAAPPAGSVLWFITDARYHVLAWGISDQSVDLSQLGSAFAIT